MSVVSFQALRQRVATAIAALSGWNQSAWSLDRFGMDPDQVQHHAFAVGVAASAPSIQPGRRAPAEGLACTSQVLVRFAHRLTVDDQVAAYDAALEAEGAVISAVLTTSTRTAMNLLWEGSTRSTLGDGWVIVTLTFSATHRI